MMFVMSPATELDQVKQWIRFKQQSQLHVEEAEYLFLYGISSSQYLPMANRGVFVSLNPRKTPCMANDRRTAGAPSDLRVK